MTTKGALVLFRRRADIAFVELDYRGKDARAIDRQTEGWGRYPQIHVYHRRDGRWRRQSRLGGTGPAAVRRMVDRARGLVR